MNPSDRTFLQLKFYTKFFLIQVRQLAVTCRSKIVIERLVRTHVIRNLRIYTNIRVVDDIASRDISLATLNINLARRCEKIKNKQKISRIACRVQGYIEIMQTILYKTSSNFSHFKTARTLILIG